MQSLNLLTFNIFLGFALGNDLSGFQPAVKARAACNDNNCLRALSGTPSVASPFCSTWLQPTSTSTVTPVVTISGSNTILPNIPTTTTPPNIPSHLSKQCALTTAPPLASRLSSACSCLSVVPSSGSVTVTSYAPTTVTTYIDVPCTSLPNPVTDNGVEYDVYCGQGLGGGVFDAFESLPDFDSCLSQCIPLAECIGVMFEDYPIGGGSTYCQLFAFVAFTSPYQSDSALLASYKLGTK